MGKFVLRKAEIDEVEEIGIICVFKESKAELAKNSELYDQTLLF